MSQSDVQTLVNLLSNNQADTSLFAMFYDDVMTTLGPDRWHTTSAALTFSAGQSAVSLPATLLDLMQIISPDGVMSNLTLREMEELNVGWRNVKGAPIAFTQESESAKAVEVYPTPELNGSGTSIHSENRSAELPYLTLPIALLILWREYARESDHQDFAFADLCRAAANLLLDLLKSAGAR